MKKINFVFAIHNHQPVGNFDNVIEDACNKAYQPFLDIMSKYPEIRFNMHFSGSLLEWIQTNKPPFFKQVHEMASKGQIELMGGGFYEPILVMLPERDRVGQLCTYRDYLFHHFGQQVRGIWLAERVWEQSLTKTLAISGVEYTVVDDSHFKSAGMEEDQLDGYYVTEDQGNILKVFASCEKLRYSIPYGTPETTIEYLRTKATEEGAGIIVYADDGEKFGVWPKTYEHVYTNGWLERFLKALIDNREWLNIITFSEAIDCLPPKGKIYIPDTSYREMMEWALPVEAILKYEEVVEKLKAEPWGDSARRFMKGGFWRNFKVKYPESNQMYTKMLHVGKKVFALEPHSEPFEKATTELFKGQCNDAYWHGVFGGLYLPHLRFAAYKHLLNAEKIAEDVSSKKLYKEVADLDLDTYAEVYIGNEHLKAYFKPDRGGHLYELDYKAKGINLLNTLARRKEAYHKKIISSSSGAQSNEVKSIHDIAAPKQKGLEKMLHYDWYLRESLIDHFFRKDTRLEEFACSRYDELGDFVQSPYEVGLNDQPQADENIMILLQRIGSISQNGNRLQIGVEKIVRLDKDSSALTISYCVKNLSQQEIETCFGVEFNVSMSAGDAFGRYYKLEGKDNAGHLAVKADFPSQKRIDLIDEWLGVGVQLGWDISADVWVFPIQTVSQSETGFEGVYQSSVVLPRWYLRLKPDAQWVVAIKKSVYEPRL
ncbi:MAG TPA: alpha-amylase/4-alpha-glucanotransferase domain-containing protein [Candidatus Brocadiales bacterium]|nr:alpha-amylase/4-alpha-glucanotransferase domain-containing protein [Candidatus Brocadiales bacterium]